MVFKRGMETTYIMMVIRSVVEEGLVAPESPTISCPMTDPNFPLAADSP